MKKNGHSDGNGHQLTAVMRELGSLRKMIQRQTDRAVALADREIGAESFSIGNRKPAIENPSSPMAPMPPANPKSKIQNSKSPDPWGAGITGPSQPVPELPVEAARAAGATDISVSDLQAKIAQGYTVVMGASGNPLTGGFLVDLGEYNRMMMGLNAVRQYEKMIRSDGQVRGLLNAMEWPIKEARWTIEAPQDKDLQAGQTQNKAQEVADFVRQNLMGGLEWRTVRGGYASQSWQDVVGICLGMLSFGCKVGELVHRVDGSKLRLRKIADREPLTYYRWHTDPSVVDPSLPAGVYDDGETLQAVQQYGYRGSKFITPILPVDKILRITFGQRGANFWGLPPTRVMYPDWFVKSSLKRIDAIACERTSLGVPVILLPPGASAQDKTTAYNFVTQLAAHQKTGLTLPNGAEFKIVGTEGHLKEIIPSMEYADMQMARSVNAMFMNIGGQKGMGSGRAQSESQTNFFALGLQATADQICDTLRNDVVRPLVAMNFGEDAPVPVLKAANVQARSIEQLSGIVKDLADSGAMVSDVAMVNQNRRELGYPDLTTDKLDENDLFLGPRITVPGNPGMMPAQPEPSADSTDSADSQPGSQKAKGKGQKANLTTEAQRHRELLYSEDQARDDQGRWTDEGLEKEMKRSAGSRADEIEKHLKGEGIEYERKDSLGGSVYFQLGGSDDLEGTTVRVADHGMPSFGGYDEGKGERYGAASISVDPSRSGATTSQAKAWISAKAAGKDADVPRWPETSFERSEREYEAKIQSEHEDAADREAKHFWEHASAEEKSAPTGSARERRDYTRSVAGKYGVSAGAVARAWKSRGNFSAAEPIRESADSRVERVSQQGRFAGGTGPEENGGAVKSNATPRASQGLLARTAQPLAAPRAHPSPFFKEGDPEHLRHVYPHEAHVNFPAHWRALRGAEAALARDMREARGRAIWSMAGTLAKGLIAGKRPKDIDHGMPVDLAATLSARLTGLYHQGGTEARAEHDRLWKAHQDAALGRKILAASPGAYLLAAKPLNSPGGLLAEIMAEYFDATLDNDATNAGLALLRKYRTEIGEQPPDDLTREAYDAIDANADGWIDSGADNAARGAFRRGRSDEFTAIQNELKKLGYEPVFIRVCAMEKNSCEPCINANGRQIEPGEDLSAICLGKELCECSEMETI